MVLLDLRRQTRKLMSKMISKNQFEDNIMKYLIEINSIELQNKHNNQLFTKETINLN